jgi:hypothetical protein
MTAQELQKRNDRAQTLRVIQVDHDSFYVESSEGKICYSLRNWNGKGKEHDLEKIAHYAEMAWTMGGDKLLK